MSLVFAALAHPARRAILARLSRGEMSVRDLAKPLKISPPAMTKHLKSLERARLVRRSRNAQWRPCRLEVAPMKQVTSWIDEIQAMTEQHLDRLESYLQTLQAQEQEEAGVSRKRKGPKKGE